MSALPSKPDATRRRWITLTVMLATIMQALDTTIANVALPHMQSTVGASQDQISWVLTSYIVASAIFMPLTGFATGRFGRKRVFIYSVIGFTVTSMLCGAAQTLTEVVLFRFLQGVFGASLVPLSQSLMLDIYPREKHASAMALWGMGVMLGPILGPSLGGWLTEYYSWRWVFYINLPLGILAWMGLTAFVQETPIDRSRRFDLFGFAMLSVAIGALQMMLDRGESLDWFSSTEVILECVTCVVSLAAFVVHMFTDHEPFLEPGLFRDRNFAVGLVFIFVAGVILLATMALLPPFLQGLMNYPIIDVGILLAPRGVGTMVAMMIVGRLVRFIDARLLIVTGLLLTSYALKLMSEFNLNVSGDTIFVTGILQGFGMGLVYVPLSTLSFSTLGARFRDEGTSLFSLMRNIGSSIGISVVTTYLAQRLQINHAIFAEAIEPGNLGLQAVSQGVLNPDTPVGLSLLNQIVNQQAATLAYLQDFRLMMWFTLASVPLIVLLRKPPKTGPTRAEPAPVMHD